jgi:hypothetical protein
MSISQAPLSLKAPLESACVDAQMARELAARTGHRKTLALRRVP